MTDTPTPAKIPLFADPGLLWHAKMMEKNIVKMFFPALPARTKYRLYHAHMVGLVRAGKLLAVDLTIDIAYLTLDDPAVHDRLVILDGEALAARVRDMIAMRARLSN